MPQYLHECHTAAFSDWLLYWSCVFLRRSYARYTFKLGFRSCQSWLARLVRTRSRLPAVTVVPRCSAKHLYVTAQTSDL